MEQIYKNQGKEELLKNIQVDDSYKATYGFQASEAMKQIKDDKYQKISVDDEIKKISTKDGKTKGIQQHARHMVRNLSKKTDLYKKNRDAKHAKETKEHEEKRKNQRNLTRESHYLERIEWDKPFSVVEYWREIDRIGTLSPNIVSHNPLVLIHQALAFSNPTLHNYIEDDLHGKFTLFDMPIIDPSKELLSNKVWSKILMFLCQSVIKEGGFTNWHKDNLSDSKVSKYWIEYMLKLSKFINFCNVIDKNDPFSKCLLAAYYIDMGMNEKAKSLLIHYDTKAENEINLNQSLKYFNNLLLGYVLKEFGDSSEIDRGLILTGEYEEMKDSNPTLEFKHHFILDSFDYYKTDENQYEEFGTKS